MKKIVGMLLFAILMILAYLLSPKVFAASDELIQEIEITGVVDAQIGNSPDINSIAVPSDANYKITYKSWYEPNNPVDSKNFSCFEDLHRYWLEIKLEPNDGYSFDNSPLVKINGEEKPGMSISRWEKVMRIVIVYSFLRPIDKIELPAFPDAVPMGETWTEKSWKDSHPKIETDKYSVEGYWNYRLETGNYIRKGVFEGTFEEGPIYIYHIEVKAHVLKGYEITDSTIFMVNGQQVSIQNAYNYWDYSMAYLFKSYNHSTKKAISSVDLTIEKPVDGNKIDKNVLVHTEGVKLSEFVIEDSLNPDKRVPSLLENAKFSYLESSGNYLTNRYYTAIGKIEVEKGYYFSENLRIKINGQEANIFLRYPLGYMSPSSPELYSNFMLYLGKPGAKPVSSQQVTESKTATESKHEENMNSGEQEMVSEPNEGSKTENSLLPSAGVVLENTVSDRNSADDATADTEKKNTALPIVLAVASGVVLLGGIGVGVFYFLKKKNK